jgi:hypothetical protein
MSARDDGARKPIYHRTADEINANHDCLWFKRGMMSSKIYGGITGILILALISTILIGILCAIFD